MKARDLVTSIQDNADTQEALIADLLAELQAQKTDTEDLIRLRLYQMEIRAARTSLLVEAAFCACDLETKEQGIFKRMLGMAS